MQLKNSTLFKDKSYINGKWVESKSGKRFDVIGKFYFSLVFINTTNCDLDPGNGKVFGTCPTNTTDDVDGAVTTAHEAFLTYRKLNPRKRAQLLMKWHTLIRENQDDIAQILTHETGKPLAEAHGEIDYSAGFVWWFAGEAERVRGTVAQPAIDNRRVFTIKQPIGVAAALVPWNFPVA
jgi:succinate-semialdehyde dehydrogenase / glutarate-semialdehyde dehydrogenase